MRIPGSLLILTLLLLAACSGDVPTGPDSAARLSVADECVPTSVAGADAIEGTGTLSSACIRNECIYGPTTSCTELLYDTGFEENCPYWVANAYAYRGSSRTAGTYYDLWGKRAATLYQYVDVTGQSFAEFELKVQLEVVNRAAAGSERLIIELRDASTSSLVQVVAMLAPSAITGDGVYYYDLVNFSGREVKFQFRVVPGSTPGDSYFRVHSATMWGY